MIKHKLRIFNADEDALFRIPVVGQYQVDTAVPQPLEFMYGRIFFRQGEAVPEVAYCEVAAGDRLPALGKSPEYPEVGIVEHRNLDVKTIQFSEEEEYDVGYPLRGAKKFRDMMVV